MTGFWHLERNLNPTIDRTAEIEEIFAALPANFRDLYQFQYSGSPETGNLARTTVNLSGVTDTTDYSAKGHEFEVVFAPNNRFRLLANLANQETVQRRIAPVARSLIERMRPVWDRLASRPRTNYPPGFQSGGTLPSNVKTVGQFVSSTIYGPYAAMIAAQGSAAAEQRRWHANLVANCTFARDGVLRGCNAGGGVRWQSRIGIGYPAGYREDGSVLIDLANPYYAPAASNVDLFAGYTRKIFAGRVDRKVQLNVRNAIGDQDPIPITSQPDGTAASARLAPERRWYLTNLFSF